ncbi:MAG TPA: 16S rRNA (guanine(527)-N(7))-methyltransferase RsmG [Methylococcus sp.]|nr:16S rRNA (guanine(527)-N(7))-methyltransferase RsmG [Methylococcus sp.]
MAPKDLLERGLAELGIAAGAERIALWLRFVELLAKWNRVYNLTAVDDPADMIRLHVLDSLVVAPYLRGERMLDVGTGAGLPGIPLAIAHPERSFVLLDANAKKIRFVRQAVIELGLANVSVVQSRIEGFTDPEGFDCTFARAYASLRQIWLQAEPLLRPGGVVLAWKGRRPDEEIARVADLASVWVTPLRVPGVSAQRHLAELKAKGQDSSP